MVVVFRDGIGEGQFEAAAMQECHQLMKCFREIDREYYFWLLSKFQLFGETI